MKRNSVKMTYRRKRFDAIKISFNTYKIFIIVCHRNAAVKLSAWERTVERLEILLRSFYELQTVASVGSG